jgi:hypothetical protein
MREMASHAYSQLAIWSLISGDRAAAEQVAAKAVATATPSSALEAVVARFLAQPPVAAAEWQTRAEHLAPNPNQGSIRDTVLAYSLLLSREYAAALPVLQRLYDSGASSSNEGLPVLLAWSYLETGRDGDAAPLLQFNPVPPIAGPGAFTALYFPRLFELRARLAEKRGDAAAAESNRKIFAALGGQAGIKATRDTKKSDSTCQLEAYPFPRSFEQVMADAPRDTRKPSGLLEANLIVDADGNITNLRFTRLSTLDSVNEAAYKFVTKQRYKPTGLHGERVAVCTTVSVNVDFQ